MGLRESVGVNATNVDTVGVAHRGSPVFNDPAITEAVGGILNDRPKSVTTSTEGMS